MIKYSIIIPTTSNLKGLISCLESLLKYTYFDNTIELIIVANGCNKLHNNFIKDLNCFPNNNYKYIINPNRIGFPKAINEGVKKISITSEYLILLNDDVVLLEQEKNEWIRILHSPYKVDKNVAVTGPLLSHCPVNNIEFILFFCCMIPKEKWDLFGPLNENFNLGGGEDILFCKKALEANYRAIQVPNERLSLNHESGRFIGSFPIYHEGGATVKNIKDFDIEIKKNINNIKKIKTSNFGGGSFEEYRKESIELLNEVFNDSELKVLDIGPGRGVYGKLLNKTYNTVDAVEVWKPNIIGNNLNSIYNKVYNLDILDFDLEKNKYDIFILGDVLEHIEPEKAQKLIKDIIESGAKEIIVHVPWNYKQDEMYGNRYEKHHQDDLNLELMSQRYPELSCILYNERKGVYCLDKNIKKYKKLINKKVDISVSISTKNRTLTTLPLCINSILDQTLSPKEIVIFDDDHNEDLRNIEIYKNLFTKIENKGINWKVIYGQKKGQVANHQTALELIESDFIWRIDDDVCPESNVLETLMEHFNDSKVGAVSSLILVPGEFGMIDKVIGGSTLQGCLKGLPNDQWFAYPKHFKPFEVEHLHCSFLFRKKASKHGYNLNLSPVGHREETLFTYEMFHSGWKLIVDPRVKSWHFKSRSGGIRDYNDTEYWEHDELIFKNKINKLNSEGKDDYKLIYLDNGRGDHVEFLKIIPEILQIHNKINIICCYPDIFEEYINDPRVKIETIGCKKMQISNPNIYNIYEYMAKRSWNKTISEAYRKMYS